MIKRSKLFRYTRGLCWYCGQGADNRDHVVPRSKGGPNCHTNLVPCCKQCNSMKDSRTVEEFRANLMERWNHAKTNRRAMKRTVAMFGVQGFKFYFEVAGLSQPAVPEDRLANLLPKGYSLLKRGTPTHEDPAHTTPVLPPTCQPAVG